MALVPPPPAPPSPPREPEVAVAPLDTLVPEDLSAGAAAFDRWLREISGDYLTLERLSTVASGLPVIGNLMALIDAVNDIVGIVRKALVKTEVGFLEWVSLAINLIGVIPLPPSMAAARMSLRPALHLVRSKLAQAGGDLGEALVSMLVSHLNATLAGEIEEFVTTALGLLDDLLQTCANKIDEVADDLILVLKRCLGDEPLFDLARLGAAEKALYDPKVQSTTRRLFTAAAVWLARQEMAAANLAVGAVARRLPAAARNTVLGAIGGLTDLKGRFRASVTRLADAQADKSIKWLLHRLLAAVQRHKARAAGRSASLSAHEGATADRQRPGAPLGASADQARPKGDPGPCKLCPSPAATPGSISVVTGCETLSHTDFVLSAPLPIEWRRTYRSQLDAYDQSPVGARWLTPYGMRIDVLGDAQRSLRYHGVDGRSHRFPWLEVGQRHHDPIEELTLSRPSESLLLIDAGKPLPEGEPSAWRETYERVETCAGKVATQGREHFRLAALHTRDGASIGLRYDHRLTEGPFAGEAVLTDVLSKQGETLIAHLVLQSDPVSGRVRALWESRAGVLERQLAAYEHDGHGDLVRAQDEDGALWHYEYGGFSNGGNGGNGGEGGNGREATSDHLLGRYVDRTGRGMNILYDGHDATARASREWADDGSLDTRLEWDARIRLTCLTDALGQESRYYYDILGYPYRIVQPDGSEEWFLRDAAKNLIRHVHPDGSADDYRYDARGDLVCHVRADGSRLHFEHDAAHRVTGILDADGGTWRREHDTQGRLVEETDPLGRKTQYAWDSAGRPTTITDAKGGVSRLAYAPDGQLASRTDCSGSTWRWSYDARGRLKTATDAAGHTTTWRYTHLSDSTLARAQAGEGNHPGQLEAVSHPDGSEDSLEHDAEGRLLSFTDALQRRTAYRYDKAGRLAERIDALGHRISYRWDRLGRLAELRNENDRPYRFTYDAAGRLLQETGFDGLRTDYRYDPASGVLAEVTEAGLRTTLRFDAMGRLTERSARLDGSDSEATERFGYTAGGRLQEAANADARLQRYYDAAGNLVREHHEYRGAHVATPLTAVWRHRYDELNQRSATWRPDGHRLEWLSYGSGHVHGLVLDGEERVGFDRDALHREVLRTQRNGLQQHQRYDPMGRLLEQRLQPVNYRGPTEMGTGVFQPNPRPDSLAAGPAAILRSYRYDEAGQLLGIGDSRRGQLDYRYDPVGQLLQADAAYTHERFAFDPAGNMAARGEPAGGTVREPKAPTLLDNLLREYAGTRYAYDARGNLIERVHNGRRSAFEWDGFGRLRRALTPKGTTTFAYDPLGRRVAKHHQPAADAGAGAAAQPVQTLYGWDGDNLAFESQGSGESGSTVHYVHEAGSFVPLLQARRRGAIDLPPTTDVKALMEADEGRYDIERDPLWNGQYDTTAAPFADEEIAFYQCDQLGTPMELTDHEGHAAWTARYKAWGAAKVVISEAARRAGLSNPIRFQGQYLDEETGLHYNRYRYYDPSGGRFTSEDPLRFTKGLNAHLYATNPTGWTDPLGLERVGRGRSVGYQGPKAIKCPGQNVNSKYQGQPEYGPFHRKESPTQSAERAAEIERSGTLTGGQARVTAGGSVRVNAYDGPLEDGERGIEFTTTAKPTSAIPGGYVRWHPGSGGCVEDNGYAAIQVKVMKNTQK